jgi:hypothetical protein
VGESAEGARDVKINPQRAASESLIKNILPSPGVGCGRNKTVVIHDLLQLICGRNVERRQLSESELPRLTKIEQPLLSAYIGPRPLH